MKKVWVLEGFYSNEEMEKDFRGWLECLDKAIASGDEKGRETVEQILTLTRKNINENPEGEWVGYEGKTNYKQFCDCAINALKAMSDKKKFRVVEAEIEDEAQYWNGYKVVKENEGVLRYLMYKKKYY